MYITRSLALTINPHGYPKVGLNIHEALCRAHYVDALDTEVVRYALCILGLIADSATSTLMTMDDRVYTTALSLCPLDF